MGILKKLFVKNKTSKDFEYHAGKQPENLLHEEEWDFYFSNVDNIVGSFFIDLGLSAIAPVSEKPNLVWVSLKMIHPREDGLSSNEEFDKLSEIEDRLKEVMTVKHDSLYAGRLTTNGSRDFYFYMGDTSFYDKTISDIIVKHPLYSFDYGVKEDKDWNSYLEFMYPNPRQFQRMLNRRVVSNLEENGDTLTKARVVTHWIYFKTGNNRNIYISKIEPLNFSILSKNEKLSAGDYPYKLEISRVDMVDPDSVDEYTLNLWELANECDGDYDGWETSIEKE
jgi:uncharacterized protein (TIGR01619 family)